MKCEQVQIYTCVKCEQVQISTYVKCELAQIYTCVKLSVLHSSCARVEEVIDGAKVEKSVRVRWRPCCTGLLPDLCYCRRGGRRGFGCAREVVEAQGRSPFLARGRSPSKKVGGVRRGFGGYKRVCWRSREVNVERGQRMSLKLRGRSMTKEGKIRAIEP